MFINNNCNKSEISALNGFAYAVVNLPFYILIQPDNGY
jgi:hypothetical protein